jgi:hypothetical protein
MPTNTYVALDTQTLSSAASSVTFSSIPSGYTDLMLVASCKLTSGAGTAWYRVNGDTASNYSDTFLYGNGSTATSVRHSNVAQAYFADASSDQTNYIFHFQNYANTSTYKTALVRGNSPSTGVSAVVGLWRSTSAINQITIGQNSTTWATGSTFTIYGIAAQSVGAAKATGGTITYDGYGNVYHTFTSNGTFTPTQALTADVLVIAGGGSGWPDAGGGGGAGGFLGYSSQSLSASAYSCTVGAGGTSGGYSAASGSNSQFGSLTASVGGGRGGYTGAVGGSGGGSRAGAGAAGTSGQGFAGGAGPANAGGGGGGAGAVGVDGSGNNGGNGGAGLNTYSSWATATSTGVSGYYAGGGGGGPFTSATGGTGGAGGGGNGGNSPVTGTTNTGSGGGGATAGNTNNAAGGSGIIIIKYSGV